RPRSPVDPLAPASSQQSRAARAPVRLLPIANKTRSGSTQRRAAGTESADRSTESASATSAGLLLSQLLRYTEQSPRRFFRLKSRAQSLYGPRIPTHQFL